MAKSNRMFVIWVGRPKKDARGDYFLPAQGEAIGAYPDRKTALAKAYSVVAKKGVYVCIAEAWTDRNEDECVNDIGFAYPAKRKNGVAILFRRVLGWYDSISDDTYLADLTPQGGLRNKR